MNTFEPKIYHRLGLQQKKINDLRKYDAFDELSDIDYLSKLERRNSSLITRLSRVGLIPDDPRCELENDLRRVEKLCKLFDTGVIEELSLAFKSIPQLIKSYEGTISEISIIKATTQINEFLESFPRVIKEAGKLFSKADWTQDGDLCVYITEFMGNRFKVENRMLRDFIMDQSGFVSKQVGTLMEIRTQLVELHTEWKTAKNYELKTKSAVENGHIEELRNLVSRVNRFSDIAKQEKLILAQIDKLLLLSQDLEKVITNKTGGILGLQKEVKELQKKSNGLPRALLEKIGTNDLFIRLENYISELKNDASEKERKKERKKKIRRLSYSLWISSIAIIIGLIAYKGHLKEQARQDESRLKEQARQNQITLKVNTCLLYRKNFITDHKLEMNWVKPGTFMMGNKSNQHLITFTKGFYLGKYEVTQAQWERVMGNNPSNFKGADRPVEKVSWNDAVEFCKKLTEMEKKAGRVPQGMSYQLPTEAQWEYACRAGTSTMYSWGDTISSSNANYDRIDNGTTTVGKYPANPWGFYDMHGNVWEWCADWYSTYQRGSVTDPIGPASGSGRVKRGGSWGSDWTNLLSAERSRYAPSGRNGNRGFRVGFQSSK